MHASLSCAYLARLSCLGGDSNSLVFFKLFCLPVAVSMYFNKIIGLDMYIT